MITWTPFFYSPYTFFPTQIQYLPISTVLPNCKDNTIELKQENLQNTPASFDENTEKLQLTREDLMNQTYEINKKPWSQEEDKKLVNLYEKKKLSWQQIAKRIPGRNKKMCYSRYRRIQSGTKIQWTKKDDEQLLNLVDHYGQDWKLISDHFENRNPKQIKQHYKNYARPGIDKSQWSLDDDLKLIELINQNGKNWKLIEAEMPLRSLNQIKNRYFGKLKKLNDSIYGVQELN